MVLYKKKVGGRVKKKKTTKSILKLKYLNFIILIQLLIFCVVGCCIEFLIDTPKQLLILIIIFTLNHFLFRKDLKYYNIID